LDAESVDQFVQEWIQAWNTSDLERLIGHYCEDVIFNSPRAQALTGSAEVIGKSALRDYWGMAIARASSRHFVLDHFIWDGSRAELVIVYINQVDGVSTRACEIFRFDSSGLVERVEALYGATT